MKTLRLTTIVLLTMVAMLLTLCIPKAEADSIRVACSVYATNQYDPIGHANHLHRQSGNTSLNNESTYESLYAHKDTSCQEGGKWYTNALWAPVEADPDDLYFETVRMFDVYYRGPEQDDSKIVNIPNGMEMIARNTPNNTIDEVKYNCDAGPGNTTPVQSTPPYNCTDNWATHVVFPRCWDGIGVESTDVTYGPTRQRCPSTHPYVLPEISFVITHPNEDGRVPNPLVVSGDNGMWHPYTSMHADYFFAAQDEFQQAVDLNGDGRIQDNAGNANYKGGYSESSLLDLCIRKAPEELEFAAERCRAAGLLPAHKTAINNYYN